MSKLNTDPNLGNPDDFYAALLRAHDGLDETASHRLNARLVLILANHVGDLDALEQALAIARGTAPPGARADFTKT